MRDKGIYQVPLGLEVPPVIGVSAHKASVYKAVVNWSCGANPMTSLKDWKGAGGGEGRNRYCKKILSLHHCPFHGRWHSHHIHRAPCL